MLRPLAGHPYVEAGAAGFYPSGRFDFPQDCDELEIVLHPGGGTVSGRVRDKVTGEPVSRAIVTIGLDWLTMHHRIVDRLLPWTSPIEVVTDEEGRFVVSGIPAGGPKMAVERTGYAAWTGTADVKPGSESVHEILLSEGEVLAGEVVTADGRGISNLTVRAESPSGLTTATTSGEGGRFMLRDLAPETYSVIASTDFGSASGNVKVPCADRLRLVLSTEFNISGRVTDDLGRAVIGAKVGVWSCSDGSAGPNFARITSESGAFDLLTRGLPERVSVAVLFPPDSEFPTASTPLLIGSSNNVITIAMSQLQPATIAAHTDATLKLEQVETGCTRLFSAAGAPELLIGPIPPGRYSITKLLEELEVELIGEYSLAPGQRLELGAL